MLRAILLLCLFLLSGILFYVIFAPAEYYPDALETSAVRNAKEIQNAVLQYQIDKGGVPDAARLPTERGKSMPICRFAAKDTSGCFVLDALVPDYLKAIPISENPTGDLNFTGFGVYGEQGQVRIMAILPPSGSGSLLPNLLQNEIQTISCNDLLGHWKLDEKAGSMTFRDESVYGNSGVTFAFARPRPPTSSVSKALKEKGIGWQFGGSGAVFLPNTASLNISGAFTFSAWVKTVWKEKNRENKILFGGRSEADPQPGFAIGITPAGLPAYFSNASPETARWLTAMQPFNDGRWHHLAVVVTQTGAVRFYKDGKADPWLAGAPPSSYRGIRAIGAASDATKSFPGFLDDVRLYSRVLSDDDVSALADGQSPACVSVPTIATAPGDFLCGICVDRKDKAFDCSCAYDSKSNTVVVSGVSGEPQRLGMTIGCLGGMKISQLSVSYGGNCTAKPSTCVFGYECVGQAECPVIFSSATCIGGAFPKECPVRDGTVSFLCGK